MRMELPRLTCSVGGAFGTLKAFTEILETESPLERVAEARAHAAIDQKVQRIVEDQKNGHRHHNPLRKKRGKKSK